MLVLDTESSVWRIFRGEFWGIGELDFERSRGPSPSAIPPTIPNGVEVCQKWESYLCPSSWKWGKHCGVDLEVGFWGVVLL